jgi:hypothetical protein
MWIAGGWFHRAEWPTSKRKIVAVADAETSILHVEGVIGFDIAVRELMEELRGRRVVNAARFIFKRCQKRFGRWASAGPLAFVRSRVDSY